jgi:hypothetical protein
MRRFSHWLRVTFGYERDDIGKRIDAAIAHLREVTSK